MSIYDDMLKIASKLHEGQYRWDGKTPYIHHPREVARVVLDNQLFTFMNNRLEVLCGAALLHDVIEDTDVTVQGLIDMGVSEEITRVVNILTKYKGESYYDYIMRVKKDKLATEIKLADLEHNMSDMAVVPESKKTNNLLDKYKLAKYILEH